MSHSRRLSLLLLVSVLFGLIILTSPAQAQVPGQNINMVSGTKWPGGDPFLQRQNEPSMAVSTRNPLHLLAGANDYRTVDLPFSSSTAPEIGDAWLGVFKSFNGAQSWQSTLLAGYPQDQSAVGTSSPLHGFTTASDPVVRAGTNGMFYYSGIVLNRGSNLGEVFVARFIDLDNKENGDVTQNQDPIKYLDVKALDSGTAGQFLDKPWVAVDVPRAGSATCNIPVSPTQSFAGGSVYIAYAKFTGSTSTKIMFASSQDCGATWSNPIKLSESNSINQGTIVAVAPGTGNVYVAWRRFATSSQPDAIMMAVSTNFGKTFSKATVAVSLPTFNATNPGGPSFFDQGTTTGSFRTNAFPGMAIDASGRIYLAWSQRGIAPNLTSARIMMSTSTDGSNWSAPFPVENTPIVDDFSASFSPGHQFMPSLTFAQGRLMVLYYDHRLDHTLGLFYPNDPFGPDSQGRFYREQRAYRGEMPSNPGAVFTPFLTDAGLTLRRHTIDVRLAEAAPSATPSFTYAEASRYLFGTRGDETGAIQYLQQLQVDPPNLPLFAQGTVPFIGDYIDIVALSFVPTGNGGWAFNTGDSGNRVFYATWTSNQDVRPPADGNWTHYTPVGGGGASVFDPTQSTPTCVTGQEGMRNQNIYSSRITEGLQVTSPQNAKPLSTTLQRAFIVLVQNFTNFDKSFRLSIANQPAGGTATFVQVPFPLPNPLPAPVTTLDVTIPAHSGVSRPVFAFSSNPVARITVNVAEITAPGGTLVSGGLASFVLLNPDPTTPALINPDNNNVGDITTLEIYTPNISNPNVSNPNVSNPNVSNPNVSNPNVSNPNVSNPNVSNPDLADPNVSNPNVSNPNVSNPNVSNPNVSNPNISNTAVSDATYTVSNSGNTSSSYRVKLVGNAPANTNLQLIVSKTYLTPLGLNCQLQQQTQQILQSNVNSPTVSGTSNLVDSGINDPSAGNATFVLQPGETALVTIRGYVDTSTMQDVVENLAPVAVAQQANTGSNTPDFAAPLFIITGTLPSTVVGAPYDQTLQAIGGTPPYSWLLDTGSLPAGLNLSAGGEISGAASSAGTFTFQVQITDSSSPTPGTFVKTLLLTVNKAGTSTAITGVSPNPSLAGQPVTVSYSVTVNAPGSSPTGTVTVSDAAGASCTGPAPTGSCTLSPAAPGADLLTATYAGDDNFNGSSGSFTQTVNKANSITTITAVTPNPAVLGQPLTVFFQVTAAPPSSSTPTGTVTVKDGAGDTCSATVSAGSCALTPTSAGSLALTATYSGDAAFNGSSGSFAQQSVVFYLFTGFLSPLQPAGTFTSPSFSGTANLGSAVPLKWRLQNFSGSFISNLSSLQSLKAVFNPGCGGSPSGTLYVLYSPTSGATGGSTFRYDSNNNQFIFNWDTTVVAGTGPGCYTVLLQLNDGSPVKATTVQLQ